MDTDTTIGVLVIVVSLLTIIGLVLWGRRTIKGIAKDGFGSAREITRTRRARK